MRRFGFYILAALLTFVIGSFIAFKFYRRVADDSANVEKTSTFTQTYAVRKPWERPWKIPVQPVQETSPPKPFCKDGKILPIWKELIKHKSFQDWGLASNESLDCVDMLDVREIDLNQDNKKEILIRGKNFNLCSAVGNCAFWIYEKKNGKFNELLYSTDYIDVTESPNQVKKTKTNNYFDILLKSHWSAADTEYSTYKFNGKKYKENKCLVETCVVCTGNKPKWEFISCQEYSKRQNF